MSSHNFFSNQGAVWNTIQVAFQIRVIHRLIPGLDVTAYLFQSLVCDRPGRNP